MFNRMMYRTLSTESDFETSARPTFQQRFSGLKLRRILSVILLVGILCLVGSIFVLFARRIGNRGKDTKYIYNPTPLVNTTCGFVEGQQEEGVNVFKGIPYAVGPVGPLRWQAPKHLHTQSPDHCWRGAFQAYEFGHKCLQVNPVSREREGSENCLFVNVWTPSVDREANLNVIVYIHGGQLMYGSGSEQGKIPTLELASEGNVVLVTFNYRLNVFGYLTLDALNDPEAPSANFGLMDQIHLLHWVQENIEAFGGNPDKVTLLGHGSGATSVLALLTAPSAALLFHGAWLMSSGQLVNQPADRIRNLNLPFLNSTGCLDGTQLNQKHCLLSLRSDQIMDAMVDEQEMVMSWLHGQQTDLPDPNVPSSRSMIIVDGNVLPLSLEDAWETRKFHDVPLVFGNMAQEADVNLLPKQAMAWSWDEYHNYITDADLVSHDSSRVFELYPNEYTPAYQSTSMISDIRVICPTDDLAKLATIHHRQDVYRYVATTQPSKPIIFTDTIDTFNDTLDLDLQANTLNYAYHGWDLMSFLGTAFNYIDFPSNSDIAFQRYIRDSIFEFAEHGAIKRWPTFVKSTAIIGEEIEFTSRYKKQHCDYWRDNKLYPKYQWIN